MPPQQARHLLDLGHDLLGFRAHDLFLVLGVI
jgi:hypothetical protein